MTISKPGHSYTKSSRSGGSGGNCVEWAFKESRVFIRDSKNPAGPELILTYSEWADFTVAARSNSTHAWITHGPDGTKVSKDGNWLRFTHGEWTAFRQAIESGECEPAMAL